MIKIETLINSKEILNEFSKQATPFHDHVWLSSLEKNLGTECRIAIFEDNVICPLFKKKMGPVEINFSPVFGTETAYMGIVEKGVGHQVSGIRKTTEDYLKQLKKEIGKFFMILPPGIETKFGSQETAQTIITKLDKQNAEEHFKTIRKGHRYCVKKAESEEVAIEEGYSDSHIDEYYSLLKETYESNGYSPLPKGFYTDIIKGLHEKNKIKVLFAKYQGKTIGCAAFPYSGDTIYYWTGASLKGETTKLYPNNLIQWNLIKWAYSKAFKKYDMLGASIEGIRNFKLGWGGELVDYKRIYSSTALKTVAQGYAKLGSGIKNRIRTEVR